MKPSNCAPYARVVDDALTLTGDEVVKGFGEPVATCASEEGLALGTLHAAAEG